MSDEAVTAALGAAVDEWDDHVARCGRCLMLGNTFCGEGEFLTEEVVIVREREAPHPAEARRWLELPLPRRPVLPGVPA